MSHPQESIDKLTNISGGQPNSEPELKPELKPEPTPEAEVEPKTDIEAISDDLFDDEPEVSTQDFSRSVNYEEPKEPFLKSKKVKPFWTFLLVGGGLFVFFSLIMKGCEGNKQVESIANKDGVIPQSEQMRKMSDLETQNEKLTRQVEDLKAVKVADGKKIGKAAVKTAAKAAKKGNSQVAQSVAYYQPQQYSRPAIRASQVPQTITQPTRQVARRPMRDLAAERENALLKDQLQQAKLAQAVTDTQKSETVPQAEDVVNIQDEIAQIDGGIEEQAILADASIAQVPIGSEARAVLDTPIVGQGGSVLLTLKSNVTDAAGKICMSAGTKLVGSALNNGGVVQINLASAMVGGQQVPIPAQSVSVFRADKSPLLAKKLNGGNGAGKVILSTLLNGGSAFAQQLLSPSTTSSFSNANGTSTSSTNVANSLGNAGIAAGGSIVNGVGAGLKQSLQSPEGSAQVYGVKAGTELSLVFSAPMQLLSASAELPPDPIQPSTEAVPTAEPAVYQPEEQAIMDAPLIEPDSGQFIDQPDNEFIGG
jgi:hypothetical protein